MQLEFFSGDSAQTSNNAPRSHIGTSKVPHPIPYQGSKRKLTTAILRYAARSSVDTFYEPFAGSAAMTIAAASIDFAEHFRINDSLCPLTKIWELIVNDPQELASRYREIWDGHKGNEPGYFYEVRDSFNLDKEPAKLLYLLARCVKSAVRFNAQGEFNQSVDKRRLGTKPDTMSRNIFETHSILRKRTLISCNDYREELEGATSNDIVYLDPPWQGTSTGKDNRYHQTLDRSALYDQLCLLNGRDVPYLLSFDGRCGNKKYGEPLPAELDLFHVELHAGRSSQSTLSGRDESTVESLYLSPAIVRHIDVNGIF